MIEFDENFKEICKKWIPRRKLTKLWKLPRDVWPFVIHIDERIIFDYIFGDMMSVSDTQYLNDRALYEKMTRPR